MSQLSAWAARQQAVAAERPPALIGEDGRTLASVTDDGRIVVLTVAPLDPDVLLRWLVQTCGEAGMEVQTISDWRAVVREWAETKKIPQRAYIHSPLTQSVDAGWNLALEDLLTALPSIQPQRLRGLAAREEEG